MKTTDRDVLPGRRKALRILAREAPAFAPTATYQGRPVAVTGRRLIGGLPFYRVEYLDRDGIAFVPVSDVTF